MSGNMNMVFNAIDLVEVTFFIVQNAPNLLKQQWPIFMLQDRDPGVS